LEIFKTAVIAITLPHKHPQQLLQQHPSRRQFTQRDSVSFLKLVFYQFTGSGNACVSLAAQQLTQPLRDWKPLYSFGRQ
jgi:hypothetical protein